MMLSGTVAFDVEGNLTEQRQRRLSLAEHRERFPAGRRLYGDALVDAIGIIELTGRGGAHFPVTRKLASLGASGAAMVVVNGAESEPRSSKDAALLQLHPHLVLDGAQALAQMLRASEVVVWLQEGAAASLSSIQVAAYERQRDAAHDHEVPVRVAFGPAGFLTGEATAAIAGARGMPALPQFLRDPGRPWVDGEPVLVHNVETIARVGLLTLQGPAAYLPTSLLTLALNRHRLVVEVPRGLTFGALFASERLSLSEFLLIGGDAGTWVRWDRIAHLPVDPVLLRRQGIPLGSGVVAEAPADRTALEWSAELLHSLAAQGSGRCGPCTSGLPALAREYDEFVRSPKRTTRQRRRIEELMTLVDGRGACRHPDGAVHMARTALDVLAASIEVAA